MPVSIPNAINTLLTAAFGAPLLIFIGTVAVVGHLITSAPRRNASDGIETPSVTNEAVSDSTNQRLSLLAAPSLSRRQFIGLMVVAAIGSLGIWKWAQRPGSLIYKFPVQPLYSVLWSWYGGILVALVVGAIVGFLLLALLRRFQSK